MLSILTNFSIMIHVEPSENTRCQFGRIPLLEYFLVHLYELIFGQIAAWAVFEETLVPSFEFFLIEACIPE